MTIILDIFTKYGFVMSFMVIGALIYVANLISDKITNKRIPGSAIAIIISLFLAYIGGVVTGGERGLADIQIFAGLQLMGGGMLRDYALVSTAFGIRLSELKKGGVVSIISLVIGIVLSYTVGVTVALMFGYSKIVNIVTIGAGTVTFIVGPVTGSALGASSEIIALSIAAGVIKSITVIIITPFFAKLINLDSPYSAMIYGGLMGTTSGTAAGLAATNPKLVPYGTITASFYTGLGCLLGPSVLFLVTKAIL